MPSASAACPSRRDIGEMRGRYRGDIGEVKETPVPEQATPNPNPTPTPTLPLPPTLPLTLALALTRVRRRSRAAY